MAAKPQIPKTGVIKVTIKIAIPKTLFKEKNSIE